jgi:hypothetical protein
MLRGRETPMHQFIFSFLYFFVLACAAQPVDAAKLPEVFKRAIPVELRGGLKLAELKNPCDTCQPWRFTDFLSSNSEA